VAVMVAIRHRAAWADKVRRMAAPTETLVLGRAVVAVAGRRGLGGQGDRVALVAS